MEESNKIRLKSEYNPLTIDPLMEDQVLFQSFMSCKRLKRKHFNYPEKGIRYVNVILSDNTLALIKKIRFEKYLSSSEGKEKLERKPYKKRISKFATDEERKESIKKSQLKHHMMVIEKTLKK